VGAALGAKLAAPDRFVVATIGDGGFIFANPTACHWTGEAHALPIVIVIFNNGRYGAVRNATMAMFSSGAARVTASLCRSLLAHLREDCRRDRASQPVSSGRSN
jgi:thiamine pyrophosphate-dependent acetolactate synthase large subunit-like protein